MDVQSALKRLATALAPIEQALSTGSVASAAAAFREPTLQAARQAIVQELARRSTQDELIATSQGLRQRHQLLSQQDPLGPAELQQLGVLSALAVVLSAQALRQALSDEQRFLHAVTQIGPWLQRAAACGVDVSPARSPIAAQLPGLLLNSLTQRRG